jgi:hypothetical protein
MDILSTSYLDQDEFAVIAARARRDDNDVAFLHERLDGLALRALEDAEIVGHGKSPAKKNLNTISPKKKAKPVQNQSGSPNMKAGNFKTATNTWRDSSNIPMRNP